MSLASDPPLTHDEADSEDLLPGAVIQGKYRVQRTIGRGGMCVVGAAAHLALEHLVALKVLRRSLAQNQEAVLRFMREARSAAHLKSEHAAHVFDVGVLDTGQPFMVMEYLEGRDLGAVLESGGPLCTADAVEYVLQACEAVGEAHAAGIIHRDLKPENLFLTRRADGEPQLKVLDFGIATAMVGPGTIPLDGLALTRGSTTFGTPPYMAPEQLRDARDVDERSDIYALGVTLYELISGRVPFEGKSGAEVYGAILTQRAAPLQQLDPQVPAELDRVVARCLERNPCDRFASVADLVAALIPFAPARAEQYAQRVSRIVRSRPQRFTLEPQPGEVASTLGESRPCCGVQRGKDDAAPGEPRSALARPAAMQEPRARGIGTIVAVAAVVMMVLTSAAGGVVDSPAVAAVRTAPPSPQSSGAASMPATTPELGCPPAPAAPAVAAGSAASKPAATRARVYNPYAGRK